ncbi:MAG: DUF1289 domain-containing protein [Hyphomicrobiales bacterium]|nr:DUF1289 domain-containing protein [Hyphomicrobiales bacterium]
MNAMPPTPCVGICKMDEASGLCLGCARTVDEIGEWRDASPDVQRSIWASLAQRRSRLNMQSYRLPWRADEIGAFIEASIEKRAGAWAMGVYGATAEFMIGADEVAEIDRDANAVVARTPRAAIRLLKHPKTIAFAIGQIPGEPAPRAIGLALPRGRVDLPGEAGLTRLGPDAAALKACDADGIWYDLGLGRKATRFSIRCTDQMLEKALDSVSGAALQDILKSVGHDILRGSPNRVIESGLGRVEIFSAVPAPGDISPDGPHTRLLPNLLDLGRDTPPDWDLDPVFAPGAILTLNPGVILADLLPSSR